MAIAGYYEWQQMDDGKQPCFIHGDGDVLAATGLYATRHQELSYFDLTDPGWAGPRRIEQERLPYPDIEDSGHIIVNMSGRV